MDRARLIVSEILQIGPDATVASIPDRMPYVSEPGCMIETTLSDPTLVTPTLVATYTFVNSVIAVALGWAFLDEELTISIATGALLIIVSVGGLLLAQPRSSGDRQGTPHSPELARSQVASFAEAPLRSVR
jgi:hypothetical protein